MTREEAIRIITVQCKHIEMHIRDDKDESEEYYKELGDMCIAFYMAINALEQEPKTGHWIKSNIPNEKYVCSECGGCCWYYDYQADVAKSRFCPNCGAKMVEPQESEVSE